MKKNLYAQAHEQLLNYLSPDLSLSARMATFAAIYHEAIHYFDWIGFYQLVSVSTLEIGPYQGHPACTRIPISRGVCGACARDRQVIIVNDVAEYPDYIACDSATVAEIVIPVIIEDELVAVLDVDSNLKAAFDQDDARYLLKALETMVQPPTTN